ncbi:MAG: hypothetical protein GF384_06155, partial [Elusimicrobia bacterium]|nr:hypothetical protein [Elusimicrobiota bacterium]
MSSQQNYKQKLWHAMSTETILQELSSSKEGVSDSEAGNRLDRHGANVLAEEKRKNLINTIIGQLKSPLIYLLVLAAVVSLIAGKYIDAGVIAAVVALNTILGMIQEWRAEKALSALKELSAPNAVVIRNGNSQEIKASQIVPGDILSLKRGDRVGADARLIKVSELQVDESALT